MNLKMNKGLKELLHNKQGETLVESLCSILIITLASVVLLSAVQTAQSITSTAQSSQAAIDFAKKTSIENWAYKDSPNTIIDSGVTVDGDSYQLNLYYDSEDTLPDQRIYRYTLGVNPS